MAKLKLKTVQNGTEGESANLMANGSYEYVDNSGYIVIGSGVVDNSGNVVEGGSLVIEAGSADITLGTTPGFLVTATWDSGTINLPCGNIPAISVNFDIQPLSNPFYIVVGDFNVRTEWYSLTGARIFIDYTSSNGRHTESGVEHGFFNVPYSYIPPKKKK